MTNSNRQNHFNQRIDRVSQPWTTQQLLALSQSWAFVALDQFDQRSLKQSANLPSQPNARSDEWSADKFIQMSNHVGLFYTGL
jgi:hypothetical protein